MYTVKLLDYISDVILVKFEGNKNGTFRGKIFLLNEEINPLNVITHHDAPKLEKYDVTLRYK